MLNRLKTVFSSGNSQNVRKKLGKAFERGPIYDFKEIMNTEGKVWKNSASSECQVDKTLRYIPKEFLIGKIPAIEMVKSNKATILAVSYSSFSDGAIESFLESIPSNVPKIIIQPILNPLKWIIWSKLVNKKHNCFVIRGDLPDAIETFGMENKYAGYIFLIDSSGIIRWKAAGPADKEELKQLQDQINFLTTL